MTTICDRCHKPTMATIMSKFNTENICFDCLRKEKSHPSYRAACVAEENAMRHGDYNFPGIGLPEGL